ncbi:hypothetical protein NE237_029209 [Protea cynaroides]|uniref:Uncharacterized protein n=1 Tax=Protea cynaroides TaxID=273540 RepID=A0A9Q0GUU1_9MAGN|nr:hypothetical protein NE237_029209 [Protea cynaroides]
MAVCPAYDFHCFVVLCFSEFQIVVPHGEPVTVEIFLAWRERFEAELALEQAKLIPESALAAPKEKKLTGRQWFECGRVSTKGALLVSKGSEEEDEEDIDFDDEDFEDDEDMLEHYLAEKSDSSTHSSRRELKRCVGNIQLSVNHSGCQDILSGIYVGCVINVSR